MLFRQRIPRQTPAIGISEAIFRIFKIGGSDITLHLHPGDNPIEFTALLDSRKVSPLPGQQGRAAFQNIVDLLILVGKPEFRRCMFLHRETGYPIFQQRKEAPILHHLGKVVGGTDQFPVHGEHRSQALSSRIRWAISAASLTFIPH